MDDSAFTVNYQDTSRKIVQSSHTVPSAGQEDTYQQNALPSNRTTSKLMTDVNFERKQGTKPMKLTEKNGKGHRINHSSSLKTTDDSTVLVTTKLVIALQDNNNRLPPLATLPVVQVFIKTSQFSNTSPPRSSHSQPHSQQSQSTVGITTPTLTVANP